MIQLPTVIATEPHLFHAEESADAIEVYASPLVGSDDPMWLAVRDRLDGRSFVEASEVVRDESMMFGQATHRTFTFAD